VQPAPFPTGDGRLRRVYISPYARRLAESRGVDWRSLKGSGLGGRIMAKDVEDATPPRPVGAPASDTAAPPAQGMPAVRSSAAPAAAETRTPLTSLRRRIAEHMAASAHTVAPVTLTSEVDAGQLMALRQALKEDAQSSGQIVPSYNDILAGLSARALLEHPWVNARLEGDEIVQSAAAHIAIAVDTERGLLVPVLRDVQGKSLRQIARQSAALIEKARAGTLAYEDLQGATFTITNLGMYEIDAFTPIIDLPQCAILGVGRIVPKQVVVDVAAAQVEIRQMMFLSLTFDHRLIDGAAAARFLQRIKRLVEQPYLWLAD
jgi:pyruvate dehydrogenase E2 component (dihydrolipoamide acetyltransferase)